MLEKRKHYVAPPKKVKSIQQTLPKAKLYESGMLGFGNGMYSATYRLKDVDFISGSDEDQEDFFMAYSDVLNSLDSRVSTYKITLFNRNINYLQSDFITLPTDLQDGYDNLRQEYNAIRRHHRAAAAGLVQEKFITVTLEKKTPELAEQAFEEFQKSFGKRLSNRLGSGVEMLDSRERMRLFFDFYRCGDEVFYDFDREAATKKRSSWRDYVCPDFLHFHHKDFEIHKKVGRVLFIRDWGRSLRVETLSMLMDLKTNMMISVDIVPLSPEAIWKFLEDSEMSAESNLDRWQRRPGASERRYSLPPLRYKRDQKVVNTYSEDVDERNQKIFLSNVSIVLLADNIEELDGYTDAIIQTGYECGCEIQTMGLQQMPGLNTVLPYGPRYIQNLRDVTTENQAAMMPFNSVAINHPTGIPYGVHEDTRQEVLIDRRLLPNGNEWILGVPGSGKSFLAKLIAVLEALLTDGDIIFVDPHGEYTHVTRALGGQVVTLGGSSKDVINAMDMYQGYGDGDDIRKKMETLVAIFHAALGPEFTKAMESILMRCSKIIYNEYVSGGYLYTPTLQTLYDEVKKQPEEVAHQLALLMEPMLIGYMACFNGLTNVQLYSRVICFDISHMEQTVHDAGMTMIMDAIRNRLVVNKSVGRPTYIKIDEVGRFLNDVYLSRLFESFYSEARKFGGFITGIVQNVNKLLHTEAARNMLSNSEIVVMLRQSQLDAADLKELYDLSKIQTDKLLTAVEGCGLFKCGNQFINFDGQIEKGYIYDLADTKPKQNGA